MRGKPLHKQLPRHAERITPADAGKTRHECAAFAATRDHPRGCGENRNKHSENRRGVGSPPRMRGKPHHASANTYKRRITPADAGKTRCWAASRVSLRDHPRGCGENSITAAVLWVQEGSPPRMRGKQNGSHVSMWSLRITPADAGKTNLYGI